MSYTLQRTKIETGYAMVPNALLRDISLSPEARVFLAWMITLPEGYQVSAGSCKNSLQLSDYKWRKVRSELMAIGAIEPKKVRTSAGTFVYHTVIVMLDAWLPGGERWGCGLDLPEQIEDEESPPLKNRRMDEKSPPLKNRRVDHKSKNHHMENQHDHTSISTRAGVVIDRPKKKKEKNLLAGDHNKTGHACAGNDRPGLVEHKPPTLAERHEEATKRRGLGLDWVEPTSLCRMSADQELKPLEHYAALDKLR